MKSSEQKVFSQNVLYNIKMCLGGMATFPGIWNEWKVLYQTNYRPDMWQGKH